MSYLLKISTRLLDHDFPCRCITLRARKALRVIYHYHFWGEAPFQALSPRQGRKNWICFNFHVSNPKSWSFSGSCPNTSVRTDFSKTHKRTQRILPWTAIDLSLVEKLLRSETNLQILRNLHFSKSFTPIFDKHV